LGWGLPCCAWSQETLGALELFAGSGQQQAAGSADALADLQAAECRSADEEGGS